MDPRVHPTADVETDVEIGEGTAVWARVHIRSGARVGSECIIGEKTYLGRGVVVGDRVKLNAMVYLPTGVVVGDGVMIGAGSVFTNDRYPRATDPALGRLRDSDPGDATLRTVVEEGASVGAGCTVGCGITIGRWALVGMGSVVTRSVPAFHLAIGAPARSVGVVCRCGEPVLRLSTDAVEWSRDLDVSCRSCGARYRVLRGDVSELDVAE
ncbi:MAG: N-acetyltransferase [Acidimicrobiia bacterium]|nr:N-acetyltransferase [Acidimicrobiia bacterium]